jgi:hypothetical protein
VSQGRVPLSQTENAKDSGHYQEALKQAADAQRVRAQQPAKVPRVGILSPAASETAATLTARTGKVRGHIPN